MNTFVVADPQKCIGCRTCQIACVEAHTDGNMFYKEGRKIEFNPKLSVVKTLEVSAPIQCRQCEDAPCANVCPNGAIINKDGVIYIEKKNCVGCKACLIACPFGAIELVEEYKDGQKVKQEGLKCMEGNKFFFKDKMIANKCDLCIGRENGPACVEVCPTHAFKIVKGETLEESIKEKRKQSAALL